MLEKDLRRYTHSQVSAQRLTNYRGGRHGLGIALYGPDHRHPCNEHKFRCSRFD